MVGRKRLTRATASEVQQDEADEVAAKVARNGDGDEDKNDTQPKEAPSAAVQRELSRKIDRVAELEEQLSLKESKIIGLNDEMRQAAMTFKTTLALKNRKISDLEQKLDEKSKLLDEKTKELAAVKKKIIDEMMMEIACEKAKAALIAKSVMPVNDPNTTVIRTIFSGVSKIETAFSKYVSSANAKWSFFINKQNKLLGFKVMALPLAKSDRTFWHALATFRLLSHQDLSVIFESPMTTMRTFKQGIDWGKQNVMKWQKLLDPTEKFIQEDSIIVEMIIRETDIPQSVIYFGPLAVQPAAAPALPVPALVQPPTTISASTVPAPRAAIQPAATTSPSTSVAQHAAATTTASTSAAVRPAAATAAPPQRATVHPAAATAQSASAAVSSTSPTVAAPVIRAVPRTPTSTVQPAAAASASPSTQSTPSTEGVPSSSSVVVQTTTATAAQTPRTVHGLPFIDTTANVPTGLRNPVPPRVTRSSSSAGPSISSVQQATPSSVAERPPVTNSQQSNAPITLD